MTVYYQIIPISASYGFFGCFGAVITSNKLTLGDILSFATNPPKSVWIVPGTEVDG